MHAEVWYVRFLGNLGALAFMTGMFLGALWESWRVFGMGICVFLFTVFAEALIELIRAERAGVRRVRPGR